jgi:hypothetical protein
MAAVTRSYGGLFICIIIDASKTPHFLHTFEASRAGSAGGQISDRLQKCKPQALERDKNYVLHPVTFWDHFRGRRLVSVRCPECSVRLTRIIQTPRHRVAAHEHPSITPGSARNSGRDRPRRQTAPFPHRGSSPASPESWPTDGSIASGEPKKSRHCGQADGILIDCLREREMTGPLSRFDGNAAERFRSPSRSLDKDHLL